MNEARPYASLSSGLLARKGHAKPAMRPQGYSGNIEDLGWNDKGGQAPEQPEAPVEHVPSSITALTPAPKIQRTNPTDEHLPADLGEAIDEAAEYDESAEYEESGEEAYVPTGYEHSEPEPVAWAAPEPAFEPQPEFEAQPEPYAEFQPQAEPEPYEEPQAEDETHDESEDDASGVFEAASVIAQRRAILERFEEEEEAEAARHIGRDAHAEVVPLPKRAGASDKRKAAFTLRLDAERHLRLRLACAVTRHSAQQIVARALDEALASIPELEALASQVPAKPGRASRK